MVSGKIVTGKKSQDKKEKNHRKKSHKEKSHNIFFPHLIYRGNSVCIMSDVVHIQVMVFIATFKKKSVIWWLSVLSLPYISNLVSF